MHSWLHEQRHVAAQRTRSLPRGALLCGMLSTLLTPLASAAVTTCPRAVFFDLGNTLVEAGPGGLNVLRAGAQLTVDQLQAAGVRIGVITNVPADWDRADLEAVLAQPEFLDEFEVVILSSQAPAPKPSPLIYQHAYTQLMLPAPLITETAFVGETLAEIANMQVNPTSGARSVGMIGIHLSDAAPSALTDFTLPFNGLTQIPTLISGLCPVFVDSFE